MMASVVFDFKHMIIHAEIHCYFGALIVLQTYKLNNRYISFYIFNGI